MIRGRAKALRLGLAVVAVGLAGGYLFGFAPLRVGAQLTDAVLDLVVPAADFRARRVRRDGIRAELQRVAEVQARAKRETGDYLAIDDIPPGPAGFIVRGQWRSPARSGGHGEAIWAGEATHEDSPRGEEVCAVALDLAPAYIAGIKLKRTGRIRCSWDLATRINSMR